MAVAVLLHVELVHRLAEAVEGSRPVDDVALGHAGLHAVAGRWPRDCAALGRGRRLLGAGLGSAVVKFRRIHAALVRPPLVLDHGRLAAEAGQVSAHYVSHHIKWWVVSDVPLEASLVRTFVGTLPGMDPAVPRQT